MIEKKELQEIKNTISDFFEEFGFPISIEKAEAEESTVFVKIKSEDPKIIIGQSGQTLSDIQHIIRALLRKKIANPFYLDIDVNSYKEKKTEYLRETARAMADDVAITGREKVLGSMPAYERRVVHMELKDRKDIKTESVGEGLDRRVVISPIK